MGGGPYLTVLFIGAVIVLVDGQLILRGAPSYLAEVYEPRRARRVAQLVAVFFHLGMFGLVALVAAVGFDENAGVPAMLSRVGIILLLTAVGHGLTMLALSRLREQQTGTELAEAQIAASESRRGRRSRRVPTSRTEQRREEVIQTDPAPEPGEAAKRSGGAPPPPPGEAPQKRQEAHTPADESGGV